MENEAATITKNRTMDDDYDKQHSLQIVVILKRDDDYYSLCNVLISIFSGLLTCRKM